MGSVPLDTPLHAVTFCVVDVETTGPDVGADDITELAALRCRGGIVERTVATLVHPGRGIPPHIARLTGLDDVAVSTAPPVAEVLTYLHSAAQGAVLVGHNLRFDRAMCDRACADHGWPPLPAQGVDTLALSRRLLDDEVPDHRLATLAAHLRLAHRPTHRALPDAHATLDLLHALVERLAGWGVRDLGDLLDAHRVAAHPLAARLRRTDGVPRAAGVAVLRDRHGAALDAVVATDLRAAVRARFTRDALPRQAPSVRDLDRVEVVCVEHPLDAAVAAARLRRSRPAADRWLTVGSRSGRLVVRVHRAPPPGGDRPDTTVLGPFPDPPSVATAQGALVMLGADGGPGAATAIGRALRDRPAAVLAALAVGCDRLAATPGAAHDLAALVAGRAALAAALERRARALRFHRTDQVAVPGRRTTTGEPFAPRRLVDGRVELPAPLAALAPPPPAWTPGTALGVELVAEHDAIDLVLGRRPVAPAGEPG